MNHDLAALIANTAVKQMTHENTCLESAELLPNGNEMAYDL